MISISSKFCLFFDWWLAGLKQLCPEFLISPFIIKYNSVIIEVSNEHVTFKHYMPKSEEPDDIRNFNINDVLEKDSALAWLRSKQEKPTNLIVTIPEKSVLLKTIQFPAAANNNLKEALGFEISRRTPFTTDQVYFDFSIINHHADNQKLKIDLVIAPKPQVDPIINIIDKLNIEVDRLIPDEHFDRYKNINLLPENKRTSSNERNISNYFLIGLTVVLFFTALYLPIYKQNKHINFLEKELQVARETAIEVNKLKEKKNSILKQINFLSDLQTQTSSNLEILNEVTLIVPDDTWLSRFSINKGQLLIQGESSNASALIKIMESSDYFDNVQFKSPVIRNNRTGKDKFNLSARLAGNS